MMFGAAVSFKQVCFIRMLLMDRETCEMPTVERRWPQGGFSLMEMLIVIAIVAILLALGVPSFKYVTQSNRATSEINGMLGALQLARAEAIKEGQTVSVCPTTDGATCAGVGVTDWESGWIIFSDSKPYGTFNGNDFVVRLQRKFTSTDTLTSDNGVSLITFSREGFAMNLGTPVTFTLHNPPGPAVPNPAFTRCLSLTIVGALSTQIAGVSTAEGIPCS
jgi:type IV fimbrial biogenesis protein FimT